MEIIKPGNIEKNEKMFSCQNCGCEFEAYDTEYTDIFVNGALKYFCVCPTCKRIVMCLYEE